MEADIRERAFFNRRLKGERLMDRRQQEIQDWEVEQARLKGQAERLRSLRGSGESGRGRGGEEGGGSRRGSESRARKGRSGQFRPGEGRRRRATDKGAVRARPRAEERPSRRQWARPRGPDAPAQAQGAPDASRSPGSLLIEPEAAVTCWSGMARAPSASSTNTRMADDRLAPSREASIIAARRIEGQPTLGRDGAQPSPKRILKGDARSMSGDDERALDDARVRAVSRHRALRGGGRRGWPRRARARSR